MAPEDRVAPADRPELDDEEMDSDAEDEYTPTSFPASLKVRVTRPSRPGAVVIDAVADSGQILIENVHHYSDVSLTETAVSDAGKKEGLYAGPMFGNLDEDLQILIERFLEERGIDVRMANFIPEYIDFKEQKEYLRWLQSKFGLKWDFEHWTDSTTDLKGFFE